jgi:hypothetical protein
VLVRILSGYHSLCPLSYDTLLQIAYKVFRRLFTGKFPSELPLELYEDIIKAYQFTQPMGKRPDSVSKGAWDSFNQDTRLEGSRPPLPKEALFARSGWPLADDSEDKRAVEHHPWFQQLSKYEQLAQRWPLGKDLPAALPSEPGLDNAAQEHERDKGGREDSGARAYGASRPQLSSPTARPAAPEEPSASVCSSPGICAQHDSGGLGGAARLDQHRNGASGRPAGTVLADVHESLGGVPPAGSDGSGSGELMAAGCTTSPAEDEAAAHPHAPLGGVPPAGSGGSGELTAAGCTPCPAADEAAAYPHEGNHDVPPAGSGDSGELNAAGCTTSPAADKAAGNAHAPCQPGGLGMRETASTDAGAASPEVYSLAFNRRCGGQEPLTKRQRTGAHAIVS